MERTSFVLSAGDCLITKNSQRISYSLNDTQIFTEFNIRIHVLTDWLCWYSFQALTFETGSFGRSEG